MVYNENNKNLSDMDIDKWIENNVNIWAIDSTEDIKELLVLFSVINRREQLVAFNKEMSELHSWFLPAEDSMIDKFLRNQ